MRLALICALLATLLAYGARGQEECGGHGHLDDSGTCACDNPWPSVGEKGWTGKECTVPVYGSAADGGDLTTWCSADSSCNQLQPSSWGCFAVSRLWNATGDDAWNYLTVQVTRTSAAGDPDLFGLWSGGSRGVVKPNTSGKGWDFQDTSSGAHISTVKKVKKADFGVDHDYEGALLCIRSYGSDAITFQLRATLERCPASFDDDGTPTLCGTRRDVPEAERRYSECTAAGECVCTGKYAKPVPEVFPGLGFEDCSAPVTRVNSSQFEEDGTFVAEHESVPPDSWRFYQFKVHESDYQLVVNVASEETHGYLDMYLKYGAPPSWGPHEYDLRPDWNAALQDRQLEVVLDPSRPAFRTGTWFLGIVGEHDVANYTLALSKYDCPLNCSGHGDCAHGAEPYDRQCQCKEGYGGVDCSKTTATLAFGAPVVHSMRSFEYDYYMLPAPTEGMARGSVEVFIEASYYSEGYSHHMEVFPAVLLAPSDGSTFPSASNYTHKLLLDKQNTTRVLSLCPSQLAQGTWQLAVYNPMRINPIAYNLTIRKEGRCLNNCTDDHGVCNEDGICECTASWTGGDCSVSLNASCLAGSRRATKRPDQRGTCWQECACNAEGKECGFSDNCADFTCDPAPEGQLPLRRKGGEDECVQDQCAKDAWVQTKEYVCLRNCTCPADGGPCALDADCGPNKVAIGGRRGVSGGAVFFWVLFSMLLGAALMLGYVHFLGVPAWLPVRSRGFGGLYQELGSNDGV